MNGLVSAFSTTAGNLAGELEEVAEKSQWEEARDAMARLRVVVAALLCETEGLTINGLHFGRPGVLRDRYDT